MDELTLHRYLDGRLDERQRTVVEEALRADPAARRTLDALREESRLLGMALESKIEPSHRIGDRVVAVLHLEERSRAAKRKTWKYVRSAMSVAALALLALLCYVLIRPRDPAASFLSGTAASVTVHGEKHDARKGAHVYDGDAIETAKGQFVRVGLALGQWVDADEFSTLTIEKSGSAPVLRLARGRVGVTVGEEQGAVRIEVPQGAVTVHPGTRADVWLPEPVSARWPDIFFLPSAAAEPEAATAAAQAPVSVQTSAIVTVLQGFAHIVCTKNAANYTARQGVRAQFTPTEIQPRLVNIGGSRVLDVRGDDSLHARDNLAPSEWTLFGVMEKPKFAQLGRHWGLGGEANARIDEALTQLDAAMTVAAHGERAEKIASAQLAFSQACETLPQNDERRRMAATLEGLAHFEQGCARYAAGGQKGSDPYVSFEASRIAFDAALAKDSVQNGPPALNPAADWRAALAERTGDGSLALAFSSLPPEAQAGLTASFRRAVALAWSAGVMPPRLDALDFNETPIGADEKLKALREAADAFALLHDELGHSAESLAALLGEALCEMRAGDAASQRKALDDLNLVVSEPLAGTDGAARQAVEGIRQAALIALLRLDASGPEASKTLNAAHDFELLYPLESGTQHALDVRKLLVRGLKAQKSAAMTEKRYENAVEACEALLVALDEADGHWIDAGQLDASAGVRHVRVRLDLLEALVGAKDWLRASGEAHQLAGNLPAELIPRFDALQSQIQAAQKK